MSMTREEAIKALERADDYVGVHYINGVEDAYINPHLKEAIKVALSPLRPVSREQVEKVWRAHWNESVHLGGFVYCSRCGYNALEANNYTFCPKCGRPFTDEAVDMMIKRMEEMTNEH